MIDSYLVISDISSKKYSTPKIKKQSQLENKKVKQDVKVAFNIFF